PDAPRRVHRSYARRRRPSASLLPYTTLFRSVARVRKADPAVARQARPAAEAAKRAGNPRAAAACLAALAQDYERRTFVPRALVVDRKSTRLNSSHSQISYAVFCLKKKTKG